MKTLLIALSFLFLTFLPITSFARDRDNWHYSFSFGFSNGYSVNNYTVRQYYPQYVYVPEPVYVPVYTPTYVAPPVYYYYETPRYYQYQPYPSYQPRYQYQFRYYRRWYAHLIQIIKPLGRSRGFFLYKGRT